MSRTYTSPTLPYFGSADLLPKTQNKGFFLSIPVNWVQYGSIIGVRIDLQTTDQSAVPIWKSIYIDNTSIPFPVELYFPDTLQSIQCGPFATRTEKIFTNATNCILYNLYGDLPVSPLSSITTSLIFDTDDVASHHDGYVFKRASIVRSPGYPVRTPIGVPALGDVVTSAVLATNTAIGTRAAFDQGPFGNTVNGIMMTCIDIIGINLSASVQSISCTLQWHNTAGTVYDNLVISNIVGNLPANDMRTLLHLENCNLPVVLSSGDNPNLELYNQLNTGATACQIVGHITYSELRNL